MKKPTLREKLRYAFDNTLLRGTIALIGWLALVSAALIVAIAVIVRSTRITPDYGLPQLIWMGLMSTLDAGTMGGDQGSLPYSSRCRRSPWGGVFFISTLIGILTTALERCIDQLRKGESRVLESGHTVILGWSEQIFSIIAGRQGHPFSITSEMLDIRNHNLAEVTHTDDFIVRDKLVSLLLAQVSENKRSMSSSLICSTRKALRSTSSLRLTMWRWGWA